MSELPLSVALELRELLAKTYMQAIVEHQITIANTDELEPSTSPGFDELLGLTASKLTVPRLELDGRTENALMRAGYQLVTQLLQLPDAALTRIYGFGARSLELLDQRLAMARLTRNPIDLPLSTLGLPDSICAQLEEANLQYAIELKSLEDDYLAKAVDLTKDQITTVRNRLSQVFK